MEADSLVSVERVSGAGVAKPINAAGLGPGLLDGGAAPLEVLVVPWLYWFPIDALALMPG